jgi:hypothetical protein
MLVSKRGMSALQMDRDIGFGSYNTAWPIFRKMRTTLDEDVRKLRAVSSRLTKPVSTRQESAFGQESLGFWGTFHKISKKYTV